MIKHFGLSFIDWVFRRRSAGVTLIRVGGPLLALVLFGLTVGITIPTAQGPYIFRWDSGSSAGILGWCVFVTASSIVLLGACLIVRDIREESRKRVIVIEVRGLRDWQGQPLSSAVPSSLQGRREQVTVDLRQRVSDGLIFSPAVALYRLGSLPDDIARRCDGLDRSDISYVLGGLAPVPFLFLLGAIIDDESRTLIMDWDRIQHEWRRPAEEDDGKRFFVTGLSAISADMRRVALCVSASYDVLESAVRNVEVGVPIVKMELEGRNTSSHWSEAKQQQLGQEFLNTVLSLARQGITEISLFLAAPASLVLRLGTLYDRRNHPSLEVNQYEPSEPRLFPWAIQMPVGGSLQAKFIQR